MPKLILAIDLMGGDYGPQVVVAGLKSAAKQHPDILFQAVGTPEVLSQYLTTKPQNIQCIPSERVITMDMGVTDALKQGLSSSMGTAIGLLQSEKADAAISLGNTAGLMALAFKILKMQPKVRRPSILSSIAFQNQKIYIADLGANLEPKPEDYVANAYLAAEYSALENPKIVLLNVGVEESKGTPSIKAAHEDLKASDLNYQGYIEGHDILTKSHDIILCDGFSGNVITKFMESMLALFSKRMDEPDRLPKLNYAALLAGLNGRVYKAHGHCQEAEITQAILDVISQETKALVT